MSPYFYSLGMILAEESPFSPHFCRNVAYWLAIEENA